MYYYGTYQGDISIFPEDYPLWLMGEDIHDKLENIRFPVKRHIVESFIAKHNESLKERNEMLLLLYNLTIKNLTDEELKDASEESSLMQSLQALITNITVLKHILYGEKMTFGILIGDLIYIPGTPQILIDSFEKSLQKKNKNLNILKLLYSEYGYSNQYSKPIIHKEKLVLKTDNNSENLIVLSGKGILPRFNDFGITCDRDDLCKLIKTAHSLTREQQKENYRDFFDSITTYNDEQLRDHYAKQSDEWSVWSNSFLMFIVFNHVLFNKPIPILE